MKIFKPTFYMKKLNVSKLKYIKSTSLISQQDMLCFCSFYSIVIQSPQVLLIFVLLHGKNIFGMNNISQEQIAVLLSLTCFY